MAESDVSHKPQGMADKVVIEPYRRRYRWIMLALVWFSYCVFGLVAGSIAPLITPIIEDLNISYSEMGIILGAWPLTYIVVASIGGSIIDRWGIRKSLFVGIIFIGLSAGLRYFANGFGSMFLCVALFGLGGPMISIGSPKTISVWFRGKNRATAVGIYMTGPALGRLMALSMTNSVVMPLTGNSWKLTFVVYGLLALVVALMWWFLARDSGTTETEGRTSIVKVFREIISIRNVQLILIIGFLSMVISHGFTNWLPKLLETGGLSPVVSGFAASIPILVGIPSVLFIPHLTPPRLRERMVTSTALVGAVVLMILATTSGAFLLTGLVLYGFVFRCTMPLMMLILMDLPEVGSRYMGSAGGIYFCVAEIGGFTGPYMMGAIADMTGGFLIGVSSLAGLSVVMAVMALLLKTKPATDIASP
ncbi:CynX/NimT family MFS transporter [Chloroflexota bacterium]